jgi:hypothetical protein
MRSDVRETVDDVDNHLLVSVDDRETEADEMSRPAQNTARTLRSKIGACYQSLSGILVTLIAVLLVSLLFLFQSVTSFLSRK